MGRHTDPPVFGSRRAVFLTVTASVLLVAGGIVVLHSSGNLHLNGGHPTPRPTSTIAETTPRTGAPAPTRAP